MSEVMGFVLAHIKDENVKSEFCKEFVDSETIVIQGDNYYISNVKNHEVIDFDVTTSEYNDEAVLGKYIREKYSPDIFISSFNDEAYVGTKCVDSKKAFKAVADLSPKIEFYLHMEKEKYKKALAMLTDGRVNLSDRVAGIPVYEYCFYGAYAPLMEYAIDNGYHDHYCIYTQYYTCDKYSDHGNHVLHRVVKTSDINLVKKVLALGGDPNGWSESSNVTLLHNIGWFEYCNDYTLDSLELLRVLCDAGADVNKLNGDNETPLQAFAEWVLLKQTTEKEKKYILDVVKTFVDHGAKVDVFNEAGVGLLGLFRHVEGVQALLIAQCPSLKPYSDGFDIHQYILSLYRNLGDSTPPEDYEDYFYACFMFGFIDFAFEETQLKVLKQLNGYQYFYLVDAVMKSPDAVKVLTLMHKNQMPVFILYDCYWDMDSSKPTHIENCNSIDVAKYHKRDDILAFYESIKNDQFSKVEIAANRIGMREYDYKIITPPSGSL